MKRTYIHPEVLVAPIALESMVLAGSPTPAPTDDMGFIDSETNDQW